MRKGEGACPAYLQKGGIGSPQTNPPLPQGAVPVATGMLCLSHPPWEVPLVWFARWDSSAQFHLKQGSRYGEKPPDLFHQ